MKHGTNIGLWKVHKYTGIDVDVKRLKLYMSEGEENPLFKLFDLVDARGGVAPTTIAPKAVAPKAVAKMVVPRVGAAGLSRPPAGALRQ